MQIMLNGQIMQIMQIMSGSRVGFCDRSGTQTLFAKKCGFMRFLEGMSIVMRQEISNVINAWSWMATDFGLMLNVQCAAQQLIHLIVGWRLAQDADFVQCNMLFQLNDSCDDVGRTQILKQTDGCMLHKHDPRFACHLPDCHVPA